MADYVPIWAEDRKKLDSRRAGAVIVDGIIIAPVLIPLTTFFDGLTAGAWLVYVALELGYFHLCESVWGQTIGKRLFDLRVVRKTDSGPASSKSISGRTVLRLVDALPFLYGIGTLTMILSGKRRQRLGDLAAGTVVTRASARPYSRPHRSPLALGYPAVWLAAAVAVVLVVGHGGDPGLAQLDSICAQAAAAEAKLGPEPAAEDLYRVRAAFVNQVYGMRATTKKELEAGNALLRGKLAEMAALRAGQTDVAVSLAQSHHRELADRGLSNC